MWLGNEVISKENQTSTQKEIHLKMTFVKLKYKCTLHIQKQL